MLAIATSVGSAPTESADSSASTSRRLELWIRPEAFDERSTDGALCDRLDALVRAGHIDEYEVCTWSHDLDVTEGEPQSRHERHVRERLAAFTRWAWNYGADVAGLGEPRVVGVGRMGPERVHRRLPRALLAEYRDGVLSRVTPCSRADDCLTARLDWLATDDDTERRESAVA